MTAESPTDVTHADLATAGQSGLAVVEARQAPSRSLVKVRWDEFYIDAARSARERARDARHIGDESLARNAFSVAFRYLRWARGLGYVR